MKYSYIYVNGVQVVDMSNEDDTLTEPTAKKPNPRHAKIDDWRSNVTTTPSISPTPPPRPHVHAHSQSEAPRTQVDSEAKAMVAYAIIQTGRSNVDKDQLSQKTGLSKQQINDLLRRDGSVGKALESSARSL